MKMRCWPQILIIIEFIFLYSIGTCANGAYIPHALYSEWYFKGKFIDVHELKDAIVESRVISVWRNEYTIKQKTFIQKKLFEESLFSYVDEGDKIQLIDAVRIIGGETQNLMLRPPITFFKIPIVGGDSWEEKANCSLNNGSAVFELSAKVIGKETILLPRIGKRDCWQIEYVNKIIVEGTSIRVEKITAWISPYVGIVKWVNTPSKIVGDSQESYTLEMLLHSYNLTDK